MQLQKYVRLFVSTFFMMGIVCALEVPIAFAEKAAPESGSDQAAGPSLAASIANPSDENAAYRLTPLRVAYGAAPISYADLIAEAAEASDVALNPMGATYESSNESVATIAEDGTLAFVGVGVTNVVATLASEQGTVTMLVNVNALSLTNNAAASIAPIPDQNYTGSPVTPSLTVTAGETTLVAGVDYTIAYIHNVDVGTATAVANGRGNYTGNVSTTFAIVESGGATGPENPNPPERSEVERVYRLYNPNTGWHLYTANLAECDGLAAIGWRKEGIAWYAPDSGPDIYRLYNPNTGWHFYTENIEERDGLVALGWRLEGVAFHSAPSSGVPVYRLYNPGNGLHLFTISVNERNTLEALPVGAWNYEGVAWYGASVGAQPVG